MLRQPIFWLALLLTAFVALTSKAFLVSQNPLFEPSKDFPEILHLIDTAYVDEVDVVKLMPGVFQGALERVDENASYIPPGKAPVNLEGRVYERTGLVMSKRYGYAYVLAVAPNSPAAEAEITSGAYLRQINGQSTRLMSLYAVRDLLASESERFSLKLALPGKADMIEVELAPSRFGKTTLQTRGYGDGVHLFKITEFYNELERDLTRALNQIEEPDAKLVLDLRNNALGDEAHLKTLAAFFLSSGPLGAWVNAKGETKQIENPKQGSHVNRALYLWVDHSTSKGAEYFCAIAQEAGHATVVGRPSLGFPGIYRTISLESGGFIQIPAYNLRLNSGAILNQNGIKPDLEMNEGLNDKSEEDRLAAALELVRAHQRAKAG